MPIEPEQKPIAAQSDLVIVAIDPGIVRLGLAILRWAPPQRYVAVWLGELTGGAGARELRLQTLCLKIDDVVRFCVSGVSGRVAIFACEDQEGVQQGKQRTGETNASAIALRELVGSVRMLAAVHQAPFYKPSPGFMRRCLGLPARAPKSQMGRAACSLLNKEAMVSSGHVADAVAVAIAAHRMHRGPQ